MSCKESDPGPLPVTPTAEFSFEVDDGGIVKFTNESIDAKLFEWNFGDGTSSKEASPIHKYNTNSTFQVELTATNSDISSKVTKPVIVVLKASFKHELLVNREVRFTNTSTNAETYLWSFGDGSTSTERSPVHKYSVSANYLVELTVTGDGGFSVVSKTILVQGLFVGNFSMVYHRRSLCNNNIGLNYPQTSCSGCVLLQFDETQVVRTIPQPGAAPLVETIGYTIGANSNIILGGVQATYSLTNSGLTLVFIIVTDSFGGTCRYEEHYSRL